MKDNPELHTVEHAFSKLEEYNMNYLNYDREVLVECTIEIFRRLNFIEKFKIDEEKLKNFIVEIANRYKQVPYHNFLHAFNLVHFSY